MVGRQVLALEVGVRIPASEFLTYQHINISKHQHFKVLILQSLAPVAQW